MISSEDSRIHAQNADWQSLCNQLGVRTAAEVSHIEGPTYPTQIQAIDQLLGGGLPCQTLSEIIAPTLSCGSNLLLHQLLDSNRTRARYAALVDACDRFAPDQIFSERNLEHLYWVRCRSTEEALRVSDILSNDRNFELLLIDLREADERTLSRIPGNRWYRLQRAIRKNGGTSVALTSTPIIPAATLRLELQNRFSIQAMSEPTQQLADQMHIQIYRGSSSQSTLRRLA